MPNVQVRDTSLYYEASGSDTRTLLFIHGMCGGAWGWEGQVRRLNERFTCVTYDRRGHSRSEPDVEDQSAVTHAADAVALIQALGLERPVLVASSSGAVIAIELLRRYPGVVRAAVLSEPPLFSIEPAAGKRLQAELAPAIDGAMAHGGPRSAVDAFFEHICGRYWSLLPDDTRNRYRDNAPLLLATLQQTVSDISRSEIAAIGVPILLVVGRETYAASKTITQALAASLPDARLIELDESGHVTYAERPAEFAAEVAAFVDGVTENPLPTA